MSTVALAIGLNVLAFAGLLAMGLHAQGADVGTAAATLPPEEVAALDPSCDGDALLRAAARAAVCVTPLADNDDLGACLDAVSSHLDADRLFCHVDQIQALPAVAVLTPDQIDRVKPDPIEAEKLLDPLTPQEQQQLQQEQALPPPTPAAAAPPPPPPPPPKQAQVIESVKPQTEQAPDNAEYLSEYDNKVDKQKVSHGNPSEQMIEKPKPAELTAKAQPKDANEPKPPKDDTEIGKHPDAPKNPGLLSMRAPGAPDTGETEQAKKTAGIADGSMGPQGDGITRKKGDGEIDQEEHHPVETPKGQGGAGGGAPRAPNLRPDDETLERMVGGGSVDHVDDVDEGDENAFNTKKWIYASFFNRMKRVVADNWDPATVWAHEDPDGTHYGGKTRVTTLRVSLDAKGAVTKILIVEPSGSDALDDEAIRAFKESQPFPNPPGALVDKDGKITFDFGFYFELDGKHTSWKVYRSI
jgi:TonB family protein